MRASIFIAILSSALLVAAAPAQVTQADLDRAQSILDKCNSDLGTVKTRLLESYNKTRESRGMPALTIEDGEFVAYADANPAAQGIKTRCDQNQEQVTTIKQQLDGSAGGEAPADPNAPPAETGTEGPSSETPLPNGASDSASQSSGPANTATVTSTTSTPASSPTQPTPGDFAFRTGPAGWAVGALAAVVFFVS